MTVKITRRRNERRFTYNGAHVSVRLEPETRDRLVKLASLPELARTLGATDANLTLSTIMRACLACGIEHYEKEERR